MNHPAVRWPGMLTVTCVAFVLVSTVDARAQEPQPKVSIVAQGPIPVKAESDSDGATVPLVVVNQGPASVRIAKVAFEASSWTPPRAKSPLVRSAGVDVESFVPSTLRAGAARLAVRLNGLKQLTGDPVEGQLIVYGENEAVLGAAPVSITPAPQPTADWPVVFFWVGVVLLVVFFMAALIALVATRPDGVTARGAVASSAPGPDWTFAG
jgi:hypothetical protein